MNHSINITVTNNPLGTPQSADGICMLVCQAVAVSSYFDCEKAYLLTGMNDLAALHITAAYDTTNSVAVYQQVSEFYAQAGEGSLLWLVGIDKTTYTNAFATYVATTRFQNIIRATAQTDPLNRVKMIGLCYAIPTTYQTSTDFPTDVTATLTAMQLTRTALFAEGFPFNYVVDGTAMDANQSTSGLTTQATNTAYNGSICVTGSKANGVSSVGLALGKFASITVGHALNNISDGPVALSTAYLTNGTLDAISAGTNLVQGVTYVVTGSVTHDSVIFTTGQTFICNATLSFTGTGTVNAKATPVQELYSSDVTALGTKQFMFLRTWEGYSGFYWNDGATCCSSTLPLSTQEFGRVANKLTSDVRAFMIGTIGQNLPIDKKTGLVDKGYTNTKEQEFYNTYIVPLKPEGGTGDISDAQLTIVGTPSGTQITWSFVLQVVPTPIVGSITGTIVFTYTL